MHKSSLGPFVKYCSRCCQHRQRGGVSLNKRPQNNGMQLTRSAMANDSAALAADPEC